jgi:hypothetical protein
MLAVQFLARLPTIETRREISFRFADDISIEQGLRSASISPISAR